MRTTLTIWFITLSLATFAATSVFAADPPSTQNSGLSTQNSVPPLTYNAISDTKVYPKPELPELGPAPFIFSDPTFNCPMVRVSDEKTMNGNPIVTPAGSVQNTFNTDSTLFVIQSGGGRAIPFTFDPATLKISRIEGLDTLPDIAGDTPFSFHEKDVCYGKDVRRAVLVKFNFTTKKATDVCDITKVTGLPVESNHLGMISLSANDILCVCFGGAGQNRDIYCLAYDMKNNTQHLWNTKEMKIDDKPVQGAVTMTMHACEIDPSGRYVIVTPGQGSKVRWIWDTQKVTVNPIDIAASGHGVLGFGNMVNDDHRFLLRTLDPEGIKAPEPIMSHPAGEPYFAYDSHSSWNNAREGKLLPVVASTEHAEEMGDPKCAYGDEVIAVATDGSEKIWRFCHTRAFVHAPTRDASGNRSMPADRANMAAAQPSNFWDTPRGNVSQDGRFFVFTSNWEDSLGKDRAGRFRQDVFLVKLEQQQNP